MPDRASAVLLVDLTAVLDRSRAGREAAAALEARFHAAREKRASLEGAEAARFEIDSVRAIEAERARLRDELLARARVQCEHIRSQRGALVVIDRALTLAAASEARDVTDELIAALDAEP
jgi:Skp family chaperone for outer membrane proteins